MPCLRQEVRRLRPRLGGELLARHGLRPRARPHRYGKEDVEMFFEELSEEQRSSIRLVSGDGARWITDAVAKYCPNTTRCLDPFHVVEWANDALGSMRIDA